MHLVGKLMQAIDRITVWRNKGDREPGGIPSGNYAE
jgi:hypothetical protein